MSGRVLLVVVVLAEVGGGRGLPVGVSRGRGEVRAACHFVCWRGGVEEVLSWQRRVVGRLGHSWNTGM